VFPAPQAAVDAIISKAQTHAIRYTPSSGTPELKAAVAQYTEKYYAYKPAPETILISAGAKQVLFNFLLATVQAGDEVVFPAPYWVSYPEMVKLAGGTPVIVRPAKGLQITLDELKAAITDKTKAILLNSPNNPSGLIFNEDFIKGAVELAEQKNIFLFMDDIYHQLVFDGQKCPNPCQYSHNSQNLVIANGVSKLYGLTGLRIGWGVSENRSLISAMGRMQAQSTSCNCDLSEVAATAALLGDQHCINDLRSLLEQNRNILLAELAKIPHVVVHKPQGTFYSFADFSYYNADSQALAQYLLETALVAVVPGKAFGMDGHLRISFCASRDSIEQGVQRIAKALKNLK
jgi:aspartate aminotransferase